MFRTHSSNNTRKSRARNGSKGSGKAVASKIGGVRSSLIKENNGRYVFDSHKVGTADGKMKQVGKWFCNCEDLQKLIYKQHCTSLESRVLDCMARRYTKAGHAMCSTVTRGGKCYVRNCPYKHEWFNEDKDAMRQASLEMKFFGKLCKHCKARPVVMKNFGRKNKAKKANKENKAYKSNSGSGAGSRTASARAPKTKRGFRSVKASSSSPKSSSPAPRRAPTVASVALKPSVTCTHKMRMPVAQKPHVHNAEDYPSLKPRHPLQKPVVSAAPKRVLKESPKPVRAAQKPVVQAAEADPVPQVTQVQTQDVFELPKTCDAALKFSELTGTNLPQPIGTLTTANSTAPSESSQTSVAMSVSQGTETMREHREPVKEDSSAAPALSASIPTDPVVLMSKMHKMMERLVDDVKTLKAENQELRALLG